MRHRRRNFFAALLVALFCSALAAFALLPVLSSANATSSVRSSSGPILKTATSGGSVKVTSTVSQTNESSREKAREAYGKLPLQFEKNVGQSEKQVQFVSRGRGYGLFLTRSEAWLSLHTTKKSSDSGSLLPAAPEQATELPCDRQKQPLAAAVFRLKLNRAKMKRLPSGEDELPGKINYFIGDDVSRWRTGVPTYAVVHYSDVYSGIDLIFHGAQGRLEYDFMVKPGVNSQKIILTTSGVYSLKLDPNGDLIMQAGPEELRQIKPTAYQNIDGVKKEIAVRYTLLGKTRFGFKVAAYDHTKPLTIDPVLNYSTYFGGNGDDQANGIAVDESGNAYFTGNTTSSNLPLANPQANFHDGGYSDAFVTKLNSAGTALVYSTYFGGNFDDFANAIALDAQDNVYITGSTDATTFPVVNAIQSTYRLAASGQICHNNAFITELNSAGNAIVYSSYLGGSGDGRGGDAGLGIAVDSGGAAYISGTTSSSDFPTANALQPALSGNFFFKSTNSGSSWTPAENGLARRSVINIAVDAKNPSTLYVTLNDSGIWKSSDGGATWNEHDTGINTTGEIQLITVDPTNSSNLYAAGGNGGSGGCFYSPGVYRSIDGTLHWTAVDNGLSNQAIRALAVDPKTPATVYVGTDGKDFSNSPSGETNILIFKSTNGGSIWTASETGLPHPNYIQAIAIDPVNTSTLYAALGDSDSGALSSALFKSLDGGNTWANLTNVPSSFFFPNFIVIDPLHPSTLYVGGGGLFKSTDGGATWSETDTGLNNGVESLIIDPATTSTLYAGTSNGIYKSTDSGATWNLLNFAGRNLSSVRAVAINPATPSTLYAALPRQPDTFVAKINSGGLSLGYSTFLGGFDDDEAAGIAVDGSGAAYITGETSSLNFPTQSGFQNSFAGGNCGFVGFSFPCYDAFVTKINPAGSALAYSTYLGGTNSDSGSAIAVDSAGNAYLTGATSSTDFPTVNAFQSTQKSSSGFGSNAFLTKLNSAGNSLAYSTYLGGSSDDHGLGVAVDANGTVTLTGSTDSTDFPILHPLKCPSKNFSADAFITRFNSNGSSLSYSTRFGGNENTDEGRGIALDQSGNAYITGETYSNDFPTLNALQSARAPGTCDFGPCSDAFVSKVSWQGASGADVAALKCASDDSINAGTNLTYTIFVTNNGPQTATGVVVNDTLPAGMAFISSQSTAGSCTGTNTITCNLGDIVNGSGATITIEVQATAGGAITNTAGVSTTASDANLTNNTSSAVTQVTPTPSPACELDTTFGTGGKVSTDFFGGVDVAARLVQQTDGKFVTAGFDTNANGSKDFALARYNADGSLDSSFGSGGKVTTDFFGFDDEVLGLAIQPTDGKIIAVGLAQHSSPNVPDFAIARYNPNGALDSNFGTMGKVTTDFAQDDDEAKAVVILPNGKILVGGLATTAGANEDFALARYNSDGSLDLTFGSNGKITTDINGDDEVATAMIVQPSDNKLILVGGTQGPNTRNFAVVRYNPDGSLDSTFGSGGKVTTNLSGKDDEALGVVLQTDGKIIVSGTANEDANGSSGDVVQIGIARYNSNGSLDSSFGSGGKVTADPSGGSGTLGTRPAIQSDGKIVVAGAVVSAGPRIDPAVTRFNSNGSVDSGFGSGGAAVTAFNSIASENAFLDVIIQADGKIVAAGAVATSQPAGASPHKGMALRDLFEPRNQPDVSMLDADFVLARFNPSCPQGNVVEFSASNYNVVEACTAVMITVNRLGDVSSAATVDYATSDGTATERGDYITALGTLHFAAGETSKSFTVLINDDSYVEGTETFNVTLSNPSTVGLGTPSVATVTITDNPNEPLTNPIDDARNYVCQHYHDFLNRQPDQSGWDFWTNQIESCGADQACRDLARINVSAAYFLSIEFQQTGYLVERMYKVAYGDATGASSSGGNHQLPVPIVRYREFLLDTQEIGQGVVVGQTGWEAALEANKQAFALDFVQRSRFTSALPTTLTPDQFVDQLNHNAGNVLSANERANAISLFSGASDTANTNARAQALRQVAEDQDLQTNEFNRAFVLMQYLGYLRRNPNDPQDTDYSGWEFWLSKLNQFNGNYVNAEMVKAFITSIEYRSRFGN